MFFYKKQQKKSRKKFAAHILQKQNVSMSKNAFHVLSFSTLSLLQPLFAGFYHKILFFREDKRLNHFLSS